MNATTKEAQYSHCIDIAQRGRTPLGLMTNQAWHDDPKRLAFLFSRYKFVAKMFSGMNRVVEAGCADAFATRVVVQEVKSLVAIDFDPIFVQDVNQRMDSDWPFECRVHDMLQGPPGIGFDGAYAVDVIEHIPEAHEDVFIGNMAASLHDHGVCIVGSPSLHSQPYASELSKQGHVNCKTGPGLRELMERHFRNVFIFSMNDEVVHTGFQKMAQYYFALCCSKR